MSLSLPHRVVPVLDLSDVSTDQRKVIHSCGWSCVGVDRVVRGGGCRGPHPGRPHHVVHGQPCAAHLSCQATETGLEDAGRGLEEGWDVEHHSLASGIEGVQGSKYITTEEVPRRRFQP